jgi:hypothetical protein
MEGMNSPRCFFLIAVWLLIQGLVLGQAPVVRKLVPATVLKSGMTSRQDLAPPMPAMVTPPTMPSSGPSAPPPLGITLVQQRLQVFMKLTFDRRQSTILKAIADAKLKKESAPRLAVGSPEKATPEAEEKPEEPVLSELEKTQRDNTQIIQRVEKEMQDFKSDVTLGNWPAVGAYLMLFEEGQRAQVYTHLLNGLQRPPRVIPSPPAPGMPPRPNPPPNFAEKQVLYPQDIIGLADACPVQLEKDHLTVLGNLFREALNKGNLLHVFITQVKSGTLKLGGSDPEKRHAAALLLASAGRQIEAGEFLPTPEEAAKNRDQKSLNLLARYFMALHARDKNKEDLEQAWKVTQLVLSDEGTEPPEKEEALERALELVTQVDKSFGADWLNKSFTDHPLRGLEILTTIGALNSKNRGNRSFEFRLKKMRLQDRAAKSLLEQSAEPDEDLQSTLNLLALNWLREADYSRLKDNSTSRGPSMKFDSYGNIFYSNDRNNAQGGNQPQPIPTGELLDIHPGMDWIALIDAGLRPRFTMISAQLFLKVNEEDRAFPYIEKLAGTHPEEALDLANEFIRTWTHNHDPNAAMNRRNPYMYVYGYNRRAEGIPLTRSSQVRNLSELSQWIKRLRALPIGELDQVLLANAFTTTHSMAEVYRLEDIQRVFGDVNTLKPKTLAGMVQTMRQNLASVWRKPDVQKKNQTQRKDREIQEEVLRGYGLAKEVLNRGLEKHPNHWSMQLAKATVSFDENTYLYENKRDSGFSGRRSVAFDAFQKAAAHYATALRNLPEDEESSDVYNYWFYASLGATDLAGLRDFHQPDTKQPERIREAIMNLPGAAAERHLARFSNALSTRVTSVRSELKHRYLRAGLQIAGDHKKAVEARKLFEYYDDLITEIQLEVIIDGSAVVGHGEPFGIFVNIRHTKEVERESGGFNKYLQNQNNAGYFYNYGRPLVNYRDDFEESARQALENDFEVMSITFHTDKIQSRGDARSGWRQTPYAYILMKARGAEVDIVPSLKMDLDFMDTSGSVVLPVASSRIPIDASKEKGEARPMAQLKITQMLDERRAAEGILGLEIKAASDGLVPDMEHVLITEFGDFEEVKREDQGVSVLQMNAESDANAAISERTWMLELRAKHAKADNPGTFSFPSPKMEGAEVIYQRYEDADLVEVGSTLNLNEKYGQRGFPWGVVLLLLTAMGVLVGFYLTRRKTGVSSPPVEARFAVPEKLDPFTLMGLLQKMREEYDFSADEMSQLNHALEQVEGYFFGSRNGEDPPDLKKIAEEWVNKAT